MSRYSRHVEQWIGCERCELCERRHRVVLARGRVPADVVIVGEAPGASEDLLGKPFCGPAGHLLDHIIQKAIAECGITPTIAITNLVGCIPKDEDNKKAGEPSKEHIAACKPRLLAFLRLCKPELVVRAGRLADKWCPVLPGVDEASILHPAAILRMDVSQQGLAIQRSILVLADKFAELVPF